MVYTRIKVCKVGTCVANTSGWKSCCTECGNTGTPEIKWTHPGLLQPFIKEHLPHGHFEDKILKLMDTCPSYLLVGGTQTSVENGHQVPNTHKMIMTHFTNLKSSGSNPSRLPTATTMNPNLSTRPGLKDLILLHHLVGSSHWGQRGSYLPVGKLWSNSKWTHKITHWVFFECTTHNT